LPVCSALDGLSKIERENEGKKTAVTKLAFVTAFLVEEGISLEMTVGGKPEPWWTFPSVSVTRSHLIRALMLQPWSNSFEDGYVFSNDFQNILYHDVPEEEAKMWLGAYMCTQGVFMLPTES
jgi:hypothetical protein